METGQLGDPQSAESGSYAFSGATWTPTSRLAGIRSPSQSARLSSMAHSEAFHCGVSDRPRRLAPLREPHLLRLRPTSLRSQDISHLLTGVFRNLYSADVIGEDVSSNLIKARGSKNALHEQFVDELQQIRKLYKQRLDEAEMLERHIIQARARALAEKERSVQQQTKVQFLEAFITLPPVKNIFRRCVDSELLQKHHLICPDDFYSDAVPLCSAPKGLSVPGLSRPTFSSERRSILRRELTKKQEASCRRALTKLEDESDHTMDSLACGSPSKAKPEAREAVKKASPPKNKSWMNHLRVPQRELERLLLARMEGRNHFLKNPRFFPPNTPHGGRSLLFPLKKPGLMGEVQRGELGQSCADTPVFLAKPSVGLFTDYEIGSVYEMVISLQNTTSTSRYLRVLPPTTPYFSLGLGMFPGRGGMVAPGMTCQYIVQFFPDCLGDFDDFISVETQSAHTLLIPLKARRPPPVLTLSPVLDCGYCLIGGMKMTRFVCKNVGFSRGRFCIMPEKSWPPPSFRAVATVGFVEQPPFGILPSVFELAPGQAIFVEVLFLPTSLEKAEQTFIIVCDNCQIQELVTTGIGQLVALDLIYISGEKSQPEPGEFTDLRAQHFICFEPENLQSTARKQLIIRNVAHVELPFHWQIMKLMSGEAYSMDSIKCCPDRETAFSILPEKGLLNPHTDNEFILSFSPHEMRDFHSVLQLVLEEVPQLMSLELENLDPSYSVNDMTVLEIEVKGSVEPFQVLLEPYALIIPGENYIGINVKKDFKMWNNSKSPIKYTWGKISDCHIIEVEPCTGTIEPSEPKEFKLNFIGGVPGPTGQDLLCEIEGSTSPVVLHIEAAFKGPVLVISLSALQFGLLRLGQTASSSIQIRNISPLPATWYLKESPGCLEERHEGVSPFNIEPSGGHVHPLGECSVHITLEASRCQRLQTVLELEVVNGAWSYLPVYAEVQEPYVYLQSSQVEVSNLYLGVPTKATITLINGTLLPTCFHWGKLLGHQASFCTAKVSPRRGTLGPSEERQLSLELTTHTQEELTNLALPCAVSGIKEPLVLGISGKPLRLQVAIAIPADGSDSRLSVELDYDGGVEFQHQASDLLPEQPCSGVLSELVSTHHLKLTNTMEIPHYFRLLVAKPFSVSQNGASRSRRAPGPGREPEHDEETAAAGKEWVLYPQENMLLDDSEKGQPTQMSPSKTHQRLFAVLGIETQASPGPTGLPTALVPHGVAVSFSLSLELLSYQKLPADQMPPGVDIQQSASGEKEMVFTQNLLLEYANQTTQMVPLRAIVAVPKLQLSTSWVDFGTCFVNERRVRDVYLMNLSGCRSYWAVLMGQQEPDKDAVAFRVSPSSGLLEARPVNAPPTSIMLQVFFTARSSELYESSVVVAGILGEEACTLRLQGQGSYNERYVSPHPF
ncbi:deleted in lung and esophageal cancer protein 1 isoform X12 [Manis pentadactyla]|uniref:deleted in lung and esophageal cancer protein 1 isoform X12 n=1 Tax=Manis pentadactyla TaxID=143292 RepID=UPI00255CCF08|nr:deleted in lung and esophageal cancer protein 1 isoform X12 [Manis pentadactyla]